MQLYGTLQFGQTFLQYSGVSQKQLIFTNLFLPDLN